MRCLTPNAKKIIKRGIEMKKMLLLTLSLLLVFSHLSFASGIAFNDVKSGHWASPHISALREEGIITGYEDGTFRPNSNVKVNEFITMALRASGYHFESKSSDWAKPYIDKAIELKVIEDREFTSYTAQITREQMLSVAVNALSLKEEKKGNTVDLYVRNDIKDFFKIQDYYKQNIIEGYKFGLVSGYPDGTFQPKGFATRAEASIILSSMMKPSMRNPYKNSDALSVLIPTGAWLDAEGNVIPSNEVDLDVHEFEGFLAPLYAPIWNGQPVNDIIHFAKLLMDIREGDKGFIEFGGNTFTQSYNGIGFKDKAYYDGISDIKNDLERAFAYAERRDFSIRVQSDQFSSKYRPYTLTHWKKTHHASGYDSYEAFFVDTYGEQLKAMMDFWFEDEADAVWQMYREGLAYTGALKETEKIVNGRHISFNQSSSAVSLYVSLKRY